MNKKTGQPVSSGSIYTHALLIAALVALYYVSRLDFVVFHLIAELFTIVIAGSIFTIIWNSRRYLKNNYFLIISIGFLFAAGIDFIHTLSYKGMPFLSGYDANLPTQLWIASRYLQAFTFVVAPVCVNRKTKIWLALGVYTLVTSALVGSIFAGIFPDCYIEGIGLTPFKIYSEYIISLLFIYAGFALFRNRKRFKPLIFKFVLASIFFTILAELMFTQYVTVFGPYNLVGHLLKIIAFYLFYQSILRVALIDPHAIIFRELVEMEEKLRTSEERYRQLFENAGMSIGYYDLQGNILAFNEKSLHFMQGQLSDFVGRNALEVYGAELGQKIIDRINAAVETEQAQQYEDIVNLPSGEKWFLSIYSRIMDSQSKCCSGIQIISHEITERKRLEGELRQYSSKLEDLVEQRTSALKSAQEKLVGQEKLAVMGQMASGVGHELRNPLAVINNALYVLKALLKKPDKRVSEYLSIIGQEVGTADKIISDLLTFARIKPSTRQPASLPALIDKVLQRFYPPENIRVEQKMAQDLLQIMVDAGQVEQVLTNLITNAYQAMPEGGTLTLSASQGKGKTILSVEDTGIGIPAENLERIFDPLFTTRAKGIGLGLTVTRLLTEANGGTIIVKSTVGKGSVFTVAFPTRAKD